MHATVVTGNITLRLLFCLGINCLKHVFEALHIKISK